MNQEPIDVVYTWVDDRFPGYLETLNQYSQDQRDLNPNRTRDNLETLRYSMRSVLRYIPNIRRIYLLTCRPQVPDWLNADHPMIKVVHHDEIMDPAHLPTFSSFAIVSHLHLLPGLPSRFLYFEDDMMANSPNLMEALQGPDGRPIVNFGQYRIAPIGKLNPKTTSPWNLALGHADAQLSKRFGPGPRRHVIHGPQLFEQETFARAVSEYADLFEATRTSKFRSGTGVPPEVFIPHYMVETGCAARATQKAAQRTEGYASLENLRAWTWLQLKRLDLRKPHSITLNDSFGDRPNPKVEAMVRGWMAAKFPDPAPFERSP